MKDGLVFDTGPLSHFAESGWLNVLRVVAGEREVLIPELVHQEIRNGSHNYPFLADVLDADWITVDRSDDLELLVVQARYTQRLASGTKNLGECGVLALAETRDFAAVVDDRVARQVGEEFGVEVTATLPLLCDAIHQGLLTVPLVSHIADDLLATDYHFPMVPGQFEAHARREGWI